MIDEAKLIGIHFEKGHYIVTSWFEPTTEGYVTPSKMTLLFSGYAVSAQIVVHLDQQVTYMERLVRKVWYRLGEAGEESMLAPAEEARRIEIHKEHHREEGDYTCDCEINLIPDTRFRNQIWRVH